MDTRDKILSGQAAVETVCQSKRLGRKLTVVTGYFDVLQVAHVRHLAAVRKTTGDGVLMVVLIPGGGSLLSHRARAELVAGISMVDYVVIEAEGGLDEFLCCLSADEVVSRQAADDEQQRLLIEHVLLRHK
jgi:glycerol-3-phosphate cytidylyltransferase-like family protein